MMKFLKNGNKLSILGFILCVAIVLIAGDVLAEGGTAGLDAGAAAGGGVAPTGSTSPYGKCQGGDIFETLRCMIANTLKDIRNIVYVVGGIGLITFTFAAIFGKISFKHLANICISLFLLSMMSPFVSFFTGSETALAELEYGLYLSPEDGDVEDSNVTGSCKGGNCPSSSSGVTGGGSGGGQALVPGEDAIDGGVLDEVVVTAQAPKMQGIDLPGASVELPSTIAPIPTLTANNTEVDTRTGWQKFKDGIKKVATEGKKAYNTASTVYSAAKNVYTAGKNTVTAVKNADSLEDVLMAGTVAANSIQNIAGNVTMAAGAVGAYTDQKMLNEINSEIDRLRQDSQNNPGNVDANNQRIAELQQQAREGTAQAKTEAALGGVVDAASEGRGAFETGIDINNTVNAGWRLGNDILSGKGFK
ncbi:MAG: hypothetical protein IJZ59_03875 [Alphaproteobacteria bacterium]|nr:hypothetical protein [Alphaproteobacteria bacterium]